MSSTTATYHVVFLIKEFSKVHGDLQVKCRKSEGAVVLGDHNFVGRCFLASIKIKTCTNACKINTGLRKLDVLCRTNEHAELQGM